MKALIQNGKVVSVFKKPRSVKIDGITHDSAIFNSWTDEELLGIGLHDYAEIVPDQRFYEFSDYTDEIVGNTVTRTFTPIPRELEDREAIGLNGKPVTIPGLKSKAIAEMKLTQGGKLQEIQWFYDREVRDGTRVPQVKKALDQAVRDAGDAIEAAISACDTIDQFVDLHASGLINSWPDEDNLPEYVPRQVSRLQARVALAAAGLLASIEAALTDPADLEYWNNASVFKRNSPVIAKIAALIPLNDEQVDQLFKDADKVE